MSVRLHSYTSAIIDTTETVNHFFNSIHTIQMFESIIYDPDV